MRPGTDATFADSMETSRTPRTLRPPRRPVPEPPPQLGRLSRVSLGTRFSLAAAVLLIVALASAVIVVSWKAETVAQRTIREDLGRAPLIFQTYLSDLQSRMGSQVRSLAAESGTKAVFDPGVSVSTRYEFVRDAVGQLAGARTVFLFSGEAAVLARSDRAEGEGLGQQFGGVKWVSGPLETWRDAAAVMREGNLLSVVAAAPVISGVADNAALVGVLAATFPLDAATAASLQGLTRGEVAFLVDRARRGEPPAPALSVASTGLAASDIGEAFARVPGATDAVFARGSTFGPFEAVLGGERRIGIALPVKSAAGETYGAFLVTRTLAQETAAFRAIRRTLFIVGGVVVVVAMFLSFLLGRRLARPLQELTAGAAAVREGDLDIALPIVGGGEVGVLAHAFRGMLGELREKRALEQLVASLQRPAGVTPSASVSPGPPAPPPTGGRLPKPGETIAGRYLVRSVLGTGAAGVVLLADDLQLEDQVALKLLNEAALGDGTTAVQSIKTEIKLARKIAHQNVVRVHDLGEGEGFHFLTMEYVPGLTLKQVLRQQGTLAVAPGLQVAKQLCRGLGAIHESGIVHRDVKPQNIMVLPNGLVKLMDFGIAKVEAAADPLTKGGFVVGTPHYMSPEQTYGLELDQRSDIYAVGAVMFEMFTGSTPFSGTPVEVITQHRNAEPPDPASLRPDLPEALGRLILACLAKQAARRPASAQDLYGALLRIHQPD
ncbi:MAG TPA: protein kinase [Thermoanaerobaculaceae bacterium]|nr:protein kinase [Thermoanaerobaculaceae bacterium]